VTFLDYDDPRLNCARGAINEREETMSEINR